MSRRLPVAESAQVRRYFLSLFKQYRAQFTVVIVVQLIAAAAAVAVPRVLGLLVDDVSAGTTAEHVRNFAILILALTVGNALLTGFGEYRTRVLGQYVFAHLREELVDKLVHLPLSTVESAGTGDLLGRSTHDLDKIRFLIQRGIAKIIVLVFTIAAILIASVLTSPLLSLAMVLPALLMIPVLRWYLARAVPGYRAMGSVWAEYNGIVAETVDQNATVDSLGMGRLRNRILDRNWREVQQIEQYTLWLRMWMVMGAGLFFLLPLLTVILWGAWLISQGMSTLGVVTTVSLYALQMRTPMNEISYWIDEVQSAEVSMSRIIGIDLVEPDRTPSAEEPVDTSMSVRDVSYAYREGQPVLHEVSLDLQPGERLAIVGPSGAGKSTLGRMLAGIHPPTSGSVTVGGVELTKLPEERLHQEVVLVSQEHHVFSTTLAQNLRLVSPDSTDEELREALAAVGALDWVQSLEDGLETKVGSGHLELQPGQAQQLALARIVLMDPHTLVLDEATSLLDPSAARATEHALDAVLKGRTVIAIAHRLYTAQDADRVAVMIDGRIVELGSHDELVAREGEYASLWHSWQAV